jgi:hypothetical protein
MNEDPKNYSCCSLEKVRANDMTLKKIEWMFKKKQTPRDDEIYRSKRIGNSSVGNKERYYDYSSK